MMADKKSTSDFTKDVRVRFAPSPTGWIHIGSLRTIIFNYLWAKKTGGKFILRVEDTDTKRTVEGGIEAIFETFDAYGIEVDEGAKVGGDFGPYIQTERQDIYKEHADKLIENGTAYYCFCSAERLEELREKQIAAKQQPMYDGKCREISLEDAQKRIEAGEKPVIRLKVPKTGYTEYEDVIYGKKKWKNSLIDDQVLLKSDGLPTYFLAVVVDDHLMKISHILRGSEYVSSAPKIKLIYDAFGWDMPYMIQVPPVLNPDGRKKLSKRDGSNTADKFLRKGYLVEALWNFLALLGWSPSDKDGNPDEIYSIDELIKLFDLRRVKTHGAKFLYDKLDYFNGYYIRHLSVEEFAERVDEWVDKYVLHEFMSDKVIGQVDWEKDLVEAINKYRPLWKKDEKYFLGALALIQERLKYLAEIPHLISFFYDDELEYDGAEFEAVEHEKLAEALEGVWEKLRPVVEKGWKQETWEQTVRDYADELGWKHGELFMLMRLAITGRRASPPLFECMELMGVDRCDKLISDATKFLNAP